jgi:hypothetical protein
VAAHSAGQPFYRAISYMLVSMECLTGAGYTRRVHDAGLTRRSRPAMGRVDAEFADWRIGICSDLAQRWVDRNFSLDYTLKSLEKTLDGPPRRYIRTARAVVKDAAYLLLGDMLTAIHAHDLHHRDPAALRSTITAAMDSRHGHLTRTLARAVRETTRALPTVAAQTLTTEHHRWRHTTGWNLINDAEASSD